MSDTQKDCNVMSESEKKKEDWMNSKWRPMMGWMYMVVCIFDFVMAPILWTSIQALFHGGINTQWQPITLQGGGLFHVAMGAVIGISAYGRTKEKLEGVAGGGQPMGTQYIPPGGSSPMPMAPRPMTPMSPTPMPSPVPPLTTSAAPVLKPLGPAMNMPER